MNTEFTPRELAFWAEITRLRRVIYRLRNMVEPLLSREQLVELTKISCRQFDTKN